MADTNRQKFNKSNPNSGWAFINRLGGLASLFESMLPLAARDANVTGLAVASDTTGALDFAGEVLAVTVTAGGATGAFTVVSAAPAAGEAQVSYDAEGVPTINFNAADAVTECELVANAIAADAKAFLASQVWS